MEGREGGRKRGAGEGRGRERRRRRRERGRQETPFPGSVPKCQQRRAEGQKLRHPAAGTISTPPRLYMGRRPSHEPASHSYGDCGQCILTTGAPCWLSERQFCHFPLGGRKLQLADGVISRDELVRHLERGSLQLEQNLYSGSSTASK